MPKKPVTKTLKDVAIQEKETNEFIKTHKLYPYYRGIHGRLKRLIKSKTNKGNIRSNGNALKQVTMVTVDIIEIMLRELDKLNHTKGKMLAKPHHLNTMFTYSRLFRLLGVKGFPIISTQPLPVVKGQKKKQPKTAKVTEEKESK